MAINQLDYYYYFMKSEVQAKRGVINAVLKIDGSDSVPISTRIKTLKSQWNSKEQCFEGKDSAKKESLMKFFEKRMNSIKDQILLENAFDPIDPNEILRIHRLNKKEIIESHRPKGKIKTSFLEHFGLYIKNQSELVKVGRLAAITVDGYIAKRNHLMEFFRQKNMINLSTENFTKIILLDFNHWLIMKGHKDSTIAKYERLIKTVSAWAKSTGLSKTKPFEDYTITKVVPNEPVFLESDELQMVEELRLSGLLHPDLCITADIYRFCMETSLSNIDYDTLTNKLLVKSKNGTHWIIRPRQKSGVKHRIPLTPKALEIIERYGGTLESLPRKSNFHLNKGMKAIANKLGIDKHITFHTSRKSAANDMYNNKGMRESTIQAVMGWTSSRQLKLYTRVSDQTIEDEFFK